jgi:hypothetical protein
MSARALSLVTGGGGVEAAARVVLDVGAKGRAASALVPNAAGGQP